MSSQQQETTTESLPPICYVFINGNAPGKRIGIVKRGEEGYYQCDYDSASMDAEAAKGVVDHLNERMEVTRRQALAMFVGSMFGWDAPGADPEHPMNGKEWC